ncbi:type II toxin-antitoxin system YoeB family toxin [Halomonas sp. EF61]|uniref:type II toxin-antitoxin system YoeB family toxin n=1 Tax=Halomonas sp. EF61 TaxID=2950869 RepID=UPI0032DF280C
MLGSDAASSGLGKPAPLKHSLSYLWSKWISQKGRLLYRPNDKSTYNFAIAGHHDES